MRIEVAKKAAKAMHRMDEDTKNRVKEAIRGLAEQPPKGDIRKLQGVPNSYGLRVGGFRVIYSHVDADTILIEKIKPRGGAYKGA